MSHRFATLLAAGTALVLAAPAAAETFSLSGGYIVNADGSVQETLSAPSTNPRPLQFFRQPLPSGITASGISTTGSPADCDLRSPDEMGCEFPSPGLPPGGSFNLLFLPSQPLPANTAFEAFICAFPCDNHDYGPFSIAPGPTVAQKAKLRMDDLIKNLPAHGRIVTLGFGVLVVNGTTDGVNLQAFVVNAHTSAFDLSVFGFEPQPIAAATNRAAKPMYSGTIHVEPGEGKVLKFTPPQRIAKAIRKALREKHKVTRKITLTYKTSTGQSQKVTQKFVFKR